MYCPYCKEELMFEKDELYCKIGTSFFLSILKRSLKKKLIS